MARRYCVVPRPVVLAGRHLLLVRGEPGRYSPSAGRWHLPGGEVGEAESPQRAAVRLVADRTKLDVEVVRCIDVLARRGPDPTTGRQTPLLHVYFLCRPTPDCQPIMLPESGGPRLGPSSLEGPSASLGWGWTDLESGLAALHHDVVAQSVALYLREKSGGLRSDQDPEEIPQLSAAQSQA